MPTCNEKFKHADLAHLVFPQASIASTSKSAAAPSSKPQHANTNIHRSLTPQRLSPIAKAGAIPNKARGSFVAPQLPGNFDCAIWQHSVIKTSSKLNSTARGNAAAEKEKQESGWRV